MVRLKRWWRWQAPSNSYLLILFPNTSLRQQTEERGRGKKGREKGDASRRNTATPTGVASRTRIVSDILTFIFAGRSVLPGKGKKKRGEDKRGFYPMGFVGGHPFLCSIVHLLLIRCDRNKGKGKKKKKKGGPVMFKTGRDEKNEPLELAAQSTWCCTAGLVIPDKRERREEEGEDPVRPATGDSPDPYHYASTSLLGEKKKKKGGKGTNDPASPKKSLYSSAETRGKSFSRTKADTQGGGEKREGRKKGRGEKPRCCPRRLCRTRDRAVRILPLLPRKREKGGRKERKNCPGPRAAQPFRQALRDQDKALLLVVSYYTFSW